MDHNEDIDKEIRISSSIFWDIAVQGGNEVMRYLSNSFIYGAYILPPCMLCIYALALVERNVTFSIQQGIDIE